jgi:hypothetical protein
MLNEFDPQDSRLTLGKMGCVKVGQHISCKYILDRRRIT